MILSSNGGSVGSREDLRFQFLPHAGISSSVVPFYGVMRGTFLNSHDSLLINLCPECLSSMTLNWFTLSATN